MKKGIVYLGLIFFLNLGFVRDGSAGGAAAMRQKGGGARGKGQAAQQQQVIQQMQIQQQKAMLQQMAVQKAAQEASQRAAQVMIKQQLTVNVNRDHVEEVVDWGQLLAALDVTSRPWTLIIDPEAKVLVVSHYIQDYRRQNVVIHKAPVFYAEMIDSMSQGSPEMLNQPFKRVLQTVAIAEFDFDNGQDKDAMALKILGSHQAVQATKQRLGIR